VTWNSRTLAGAGARAVEGLDAVDSVRSGFPAWGDAGLRGCGRVGVCPASISSAPDLPGARCAFSAASTSSSSTANGPGRCWGGCGAGTSFASCSVKRTGEALMRLEAEVAWP